MPAYSIVSKTELVNKPDSEIYKFLINFNHFRDLLPPDKISNWVCSEDVCSFSVSGIISIQLHLDERIPYTLVKYMSAPNSKYPFNFSVFIQKHDDENANCSIKMDYELNSILNGMAENTLKNIVNKMVEKLKEI